ncbi:MAG: DUF5013 domain-containing protein [Paludibacteraceae bacterium]
MRKKLLLCSIALVSILQFAFAVDPVDITDQYLQNYTKPFTTTGVSLNNGNARWQQLAAPWVTQNDVTDGSVITTWHADANKGNSMTFTSGWDGFSSTLQNLKVYQTVTLPAGNYDLVILSHGSATSYDWNAASGVYLVVAKGVGIPNIADLSTAISSTVLTNFVLVGTQGQVTLNFVLTEETKVSLGCVGTMTGSKCVAIAKYTLNQYLGANYNPLKNLLATAKGYTNADYPIGTTMGTYPQAKWDALQAAIASVEAFIALGEDGTQEAVDAKKAELQAAIDDLNGSIILPFKVSDASSTTWYQIHDWRPTPSYWQLGEYTSEDGQVSAPLALIMSQTSDNTLDDQLFKIVKAPAPSKGYYIYNKLIENSPLSADLDKNLVAIDETSTTPTTWQFGKTINGAYFTIFVEGDKTSQLNSYADYTPPYIAFYYPGDGENDYGNDWTFVELVEAGKTDFNALKVLVATANGMTTANYPIGTGENQYSLEKWNAFVAVRTQALALLNKENTTPQPTQEEVDNMVTALQTAINDLIASKNPPFFLSTTTDSHWYTINDMRTNKSYWKVGKYVGTETIDNRLIMVKGVPSTITDSLLFKFVKPEDTSLLGYYVYNKLDNVNALSGDVETNFIGINSTLSVSTWLFDESTNKGYYLISIEGGANQVNSYAGYNPPYIGFYNGGSGDAGNNWALTPSNLTSVKEVSANQLQVYVVNRMVFAKNSDSQLSVYNVRGQKMDAKKQLIPGVYIVKIENTQEVTKVIVR